jgi:hypothetical protein
VKQYIDSHQEKFLLQFLGHDALLLEYQTLIQDIGNPIHVFPFYNNTIILGDYTVDFSVLNIVDHSLKVWAVIVRAGPAVIHVLAYHMKVIVPCVGLKHGALRLDTRAFPLLLIVAA